MRELSILITEAMAGRKVKSLLRRELSIPAGMIARLKTRPGVITLNGLPCRSIDPVAPGDTLTVQVGDSPDKGRFEPIACPLDIVFEDDDLLVINKAPGMAVHGSGERGEPTLGNALAHHLGAGAAFHPVNRLDKGTSGLMLVAKSGYIHERMRLSLHTDSLRREYLLICSPAPEEKSGLIDLPIAREPGSPIKRCISPDGQSAQTGYEVLSENAGMALVRARLRTGRTHQIRLHFAALGCPLAGDWLYGEASEKIHRPALHSAFLSFVHPITGEELSFESPLPGDMEELFYGRDP